jgi:membrane protease YdiL (CAAX protease family)
VELALLERNPSTLAVGLVLAVLVTGLLIDQAAPGGHVAVGLGLAACLLAVARAARLTVADLGLSRPAWPSGLRWGAAAAAVVAAAYALALLVPPVRQALPDTGGGVGRAALLAALVVVPLGTVLPEELAFRGLLLALLGRGHGVRAATLLSSGLFGLWHILPSLGGGVADAAGTLLRVVVTVCVTSAAGVVLCVLRLRSGSLLAPVLAHWAVNGLGIMLALLA